MYDATVLLAGLSDGVGDGQPSAGDEHAGAEHDDTTGVLLRKMMKMQDSFEFMLSHVLFNYFIYLFHLFSVFTYT